MRHGDKVNNLGRTSSHRKAMLSNMAISLLTHKRIFTTLPKAKELRKFVEPIITRSKSDTTHNRRMAFADLRSNKEAVALLFRDIAVKVANRPGGYTRIIKTGPRPGDNADMCMIELVDFNELLLGGETAAAGKKAKVTRRSRAKKDAPATDATGDDASTEVTAKAPAKPRAKKAKPAEGESNKDENTGE